MCSSRLEHFGFRSAVLPGCLVGVTSRNRHRAFRRVRRAVRKGFRVGEEVDDAIFERFDGEAELVRVVDGNERGPELFDADEGDVAFEQLEGRLFGEPVEELVGIAFFVGDLDQTGVFKIFCHGADIRMVVEVDRFDVGLILVDHDGAAEGLDIKIFYSGLVELFLESGFGLVSGFFDGIGGDVNYGRPEGRQLADSA